MIFNDSIKNDSTSLTGTNQPSSTTSLDEIQKRVLSLVSDLRFPQFSSPISSADGLHIRNTPSHPQTGGLFDETGELAGRIHLGIDIFAEIGTGVAAAEDGVVVLAGDVGDYGNVVYVNHPGGYQTRYAHLSEISVKEGDTVSRGTLVGLAGNSGNAKDAEPHVHFEVRKINDWNAQDLNACWAIGNEQSSPQDPMPFILGHPVVQPLPTPKQQVQQQTTQNKQSQHPEEGDQKKKEGWKEKLKREILDKLFTFMDKNQDTKVTKEELTELFSSHLEYFGGRMTKDDLCDVLHEGAGIGLGKGETAEKLMKVLDVNGDGVLTTDEVDQMVKNIVSCTDANGDQGISREEFNGF